MPKKIDFETVRKIGTELPGVEEGIAYGSPALRVRGKLLACIPVHRSAEPGSLVVCVDFSDRKQLLAEAPDVYYVTEHYAIADKTRGAEGVARDGSQVCDGQDGIWYAPA